jgi:hypothetical protein
LHIPDIWTAVSANSVPGQVLGFPVEFEGGLRSRPSERHCKAEKKKNAGIPNFRLQASKGPHLGPGMVSRRKLNEDGNKV